MRIDDLIRRLQTIRKSLLDWDTTTWQEKWYYRVGLLTGFLGGTAVGLLMAIAWYIFKDACGG